MSNTQTPRTDAAESNWWSEDGLRSAFIVRADFARELERENAILTAERDEARRDVCDMMHYTGFLAGDYANSRGWDCFKDMRREVSQDVKDFLAILRRDQEVIESSRNKLEELLRACLREGVGATVTSSGVSLRDGGCGCCSDVPRLLTEEQISMIEQILR